PLSRHSFPTRRSSDLRGQLWTIAFFVMAALAIAMVLVSFDSKVGFQGFRVANLGGFRIGVVLLTLAFAAYVFEKEVHLRRLTRLDRKSTRLNSSHQII